MSACAARLLAQAVVNVLRDGVTGRAFADVVGAAFVGVAATHARAAAVLVVAVQDHGTGGFI